MPHGAHIPETEDFFEIVVLGAGVVGLTTALEIQQRGKGKYRVTVVADAFPGDPNTGVKYTSQWAGAHHVYNKRDRKTYPDDLLYHLEKETFAKLWELSEPGTDTEECFLRVPQTEHFYAERITENNPGPDPLEEMPLYKPIPQQNLPPGALSGCTFNTVTIDVPIYLNWLFTRFIGLGGRTVRGHVQHLSQIIEGGIGIFGDRYASAVAKYGVYTLGLHGHPENGQHEQNAGSSSAINVSGDVVEKLHTRRRKGKVDAVIVCTGIASRFLGGVEDPDVYPIRGQTVIIRAPWVRFSRTESGMKNEKGESVVTYIIPRRSSDVIVGGTLLTNDWYPHPREETMMEIISRAIKLCPELAPPEIRAVREPKIEDLLRHVVGEGCGLRPGRTSGIRLESEWWDHKGKLTPGERDGNNEGKALVVYNYGHAGYGYQSSWGCATRVVELLEKGLKQL